jgi:hypothetical protein
MRLAEKLAVCLAVILPILSSAQSTNENRPPAATSHKYLLMTSHTPEQCAASLSRIAAHDRKLFESMDWGCSAGDHTGYAMVWATTPDEAVMKLPDTERTGAKAVLVKRFTVEEAQRLHQKP